MNEKKPLLQVEGLKMYFPLKKGLLSRTYCHVKAVDDVSFEVREGETFGIVGESGCGKTTTGKCILRIHDPTDGKIIYNGRDISKLPKSKFKENRRELQLIFQDPYESLDPRQSVCSILEEAIVCDRKFHTKEEIKKRMRELLSLVELHQDIALRYPHELSGGQRQRLGVARALACNPKLIVCDEPVSALDVSIQAQIINLFRRLQEELGLTYIFVAHDLAVVRHIAGRIGVMYLGRMVEILDSDDLFENSRHPYTKALLSAVPTTDYYREKRRERIVLEGEVPSPINAPPGCPFHPRCRYATDICRTTMPELLDRGRNHLVACYHDGPCES
ncbi:peptide/nickel transport system ATP-binding protein [Sporobacter termitidis DSM 10068]|uniref:Peptide/nickel transport system ATP-binding protein n=1 Tax=Sporobacter termitidis DSM 10068 TaxID=1123282 RepID=A0A1M5YRL7_9FIRM|nr:ABC transporter ATP-binding protein [Sporobacter termitidis]SHI14498.1 peptide/nickel transport system ATP-binding protein [Sporobacter termitidis DSM 10068]